MAFVKALSNHLLTLDPDIYALVNFQGAVQSTKTGEVLLTEFILPEKLNQVHYMIEEESYFLITKSSNDLNKSSRSEIFQQTIRTDGPNHLEFQSYVSVWTEYLELRSPNQLGYQSQMDEQDLLW